jgi:methyl-accepting chemotaxis protein
LAQEYLTSSDLTRAAEVLHRCLGQSQIAVILMLAAAMAVFVVIVRNVSDSVTKPIAALTAYLHRMGTTGEMDTEESERMILEKFVSSKETVGTCIAGAMVLVTRIQYIANSLETIAGGDLTADVRILSKKDIIGLSLQHMVGNLNQRFSEVKASAGQVSAGSSQVAEGAQTLSQGAVEQAASIIELSDTIVSITQKTKENADTAEKTADLTDTILSGAERGSLHMNEMLSAVSEITKASKDIGKIMRDINDISFQTNILSLNAAVEAAHAGDLGKGFSVVAEEVRKLAERSAVAAKETEELIENSIKKAELGARIANETAASFTEIVHGVKESNRLVREIAVASEEQAFGIELVNVGVAQMAQVIQQSSSAAEESAAVSEEMNSQSILLRELVSTFKLKENEPGLKQDVSHSSQAIKAA